MQTVVGHRCEIWSLAVLHRPQSNTGSNNTNNSTGGVNALILTGAADELLRGYRLCTSTSSTPAKSTISLKGEVTTTNTGAVAVTATGGYAEDDTMRVIEHFGSLERTAAHGSDKCAGLSFNPAGNLLAAQSSGKAIEVMTIAAAAVKYIILYV